MNSYSSSSSSSPCAACIVTSRFRMFVRTELLRAIFLQSSRNMTSSISFESCIRRKHSEVVRRRQAKNRPDGARLSIRRQQMSFSSMAEARLFLQMETLFIVWSQWKCTINLLTVCIRRMHRWETSEVFWWWAPGAMAIAIPTAIERCSVIVSSTE